MLFRSFQDMFFWRALLGIGEASYGIIAPALLSDLFAPKYQIRVPSRDSCSGSRAWDSTCST